MPDETTRLRAEVSTGGAEVAALKLEDVQKAIREVTQKLEQDAQAAGVAAVAGDKLTISKEALSRVLYSLHPRLGEFGMMLVRCADVAGALAQKNVDLSSMFQNATAAVIEHAGALKLLAAGGAALAGINAISRALQANAEHHARVAKAIRDEADALDTLARARSQEMEARERASAGRGEGPMTAGESRAAQAARERLATTVPFVAKEAQRQAVLLAGAGAPDELVSALAIALDQPKGKPLDIEKLLRLPPERRRGVIDRILSPRGTDTGGIRAREQEQRGEMLGQAVRETNVQGGTTGAIESFIETLPGGVGIGVDGKQLARVVAALGGTADLQVHEMAALFGPAVSDLLKGQSGQYNDLEARQKLVAAEGVKTEEPEMIRRAEFILQQLHIAAQEQREAARAQKDAAERFEQARPVVQNVFHNARVIGADSYSQRKRTRNGELLAESRSRP